MSVNLVINGVSYTFPEPLDTGWGQNVTDWATAVSTTTLQRTGGTFTLSAEVDFGAGFGVKGLYWKGRTANPAVAGQVRLARADTVNWRNQANSADLPLGVDASNRLTFNGAVVPGGAALTASRAVVTDGSGALASSATTATEVGFVNGVTSAIQTQLNAKLNLSGGVLSGNLDLDGNDLILDAAGTVVIDNGGSSLLRVQEGGADVFRVRTGGLADVVSTDGGATVGPSLRTFRQSASPAASDIIGSVDFYGRDSAANDQLYATVRGVITDPTSTSEDSALAVDVNIAGAQTEVARFVSGGLQLPTQTASRVAVLDSSKNLIASTNAVSDSDLAFLSDMNLRQLTYTDNGAGQGPTFRLFRESSSPAASDNIGLMDFSGRNSSATSFVYGRIAAIITDPTAGSEDGQFSMSVPIAGAVTEVARLNNLGLVLPTVTASRALTTSASNAITASATTATELGFVNGVTSAIQTQINNGPPPLATYTPSAVASFDITSVINSGTWDWYEIFYDFTVSTDDSALQVRTDDANGASFDTGGTDYRFTNLASASSGTPTAVVSNGAAAINITSATAGEKIGNASGEHVSGVLRIVSLGSVSKHPLLTWETTWLDPTTRLQQTRGAGSRANSAAINAVQFLVSAGNLSGTARVYGRKNS